MEREWWEEDRGFSAEKTLWQVAMYGAYDALTPREFDLASLMLEHADQRLFVATGRLYCRLSPTDLARMSRQRETQVNQIQSRLADHGITRLVKGRYQFLPSFLDHAPNPSSRLPAARN